MKALCLLFASAAFVSAQLPSAKPIPRVQAVPMPHHITSFQLDGRELTAMHFDPQDMRPFWHPIRASSDVSLTRMGHPHDPLTHSHHNSVWVTHNMVNDLDFWGDYAKKQGRIVNVEVSREGYEDTDEFASMRMVNHWISEADESIQLTEVLPRRPAWHEIRVRDDYSRSVGMSRQDAHGLAALHQQCLFGSQCFQRIQDGIEALPISRRLAQAAIDNQVLRTLGDFGVEVVLNHAVSGFDLPIFARQLCATRSADDAGCAGWSRNRCGHNGILSGIVRINKAT
jgi:hypothetical protein